MSGDTPHKYDDTSSTPPTATITPTSRTRKMSMTVTDSNQPREGFPRPFPGTPNNVLEQFQMAGKVVVVTGAADGIGYAVAEAMAEARGHVALWYNS